MGRAWSACKAICAGFKGELQLGPVPGLYTRPTCRLLAADRLLGSARRGCAGGLLVELRDAWTVDGAGARSFSVLIEEFVEGLAVARSVGR